MWLTAALDRGTWVDVVLAMAVCGTHVSHVPRHVRVPKDDDIGVGEPAPQAFGSAGRRAAVVQHCDLAPTEADGQLDRQRKASIVVAEHGVDRREFGQRFEERCIGDITRVEDDISLCEQTGDPTDEHVGLARAEMGVCDEQHVDHW